MFLLPKAIQSLWNGLVNRGLLPVIKGLDIFLVIISIGLIGLASTETGRQDGIKAMYNNLFKKLWD